LSIGFYRLTTGGMKQFILSADAEHALMPTSMSRFKPKALKIHLENIFRIGLTSGIANGEYAM
jgi:hypothetical protein